MCSEITAEGKKVTKLDSILLNGSNIAIVSRSHTRTSLSQRQRVPWSDCVPSHSSDGIMGVLSEFQLVPGGAPDSR